MPLFFCNENVIKNGVASFEGSIGLWYNVYIDNN